MTPIPEENQPREGRIYGPWLEDTVCHGRVAWWWQPLKAAVCEAACLYLFGDRLQTLRSTPLLQWGPTSQRFLNLPKQCHGIGTNSSNTRACGGHFTSKQRQHGSHVWKKKFRNVNFYRPVPLFISFLFLFFSFFRKDLGIQSKGQLKGEECGMSLQENS